MTRNDLQRHIAALRPFDEAAYRGVLRHWDALAKPLDGLGEFERLLARIGGIQRTDRPRLDRRSLLVFLADNGVVAEGVSQSGPEVTHAVAEAMARGRSTVCVMAKRAGVEVRPVDVGMLGAPVPGIENRRVRSGSRNLRREAAMTEAETLAAMEAGMLAARRAKAEGADILLLGEMGIGNTTTATAVSCALLGREPAVGRGAGLDNRRMERKCAVIREALARLGGAADQPLRVLAELGGYDIAAMTGAILAAAELDLPVVLDGLITLAAALAAERLAPGVTAVCLASHHPREPMGQALLEALGLRGILHADMALGEGTGAVLLLPPLDVCLALYNEGERFEGIGVEAYRRFGTMEL